MVEHVAPGTPHRMNIVITGGSGFLGRRLAETLLERGVLRGTDGRDAPDRSDHARRRRACAGLYRRPYPIRSLATSPIASCSKRAIDTATTSIFHLAAVVSGQAEADFDLGMRVNLDASRHLLEVCRQPRASSARRVHELGGRLRRRPAGDGARQPGGHASDVVRHAESDGRAPDQRLHAARFRRRPLAEASDDLRPAGPPERRRVVFCERHHPRAAQRRDVAHARSAPPRVSGCCRRAPRSSVSSPPTTSTARRSGRTVS